jgi:hypothetical protein
MKVTFEGRMTISPEKMNVGAVREGRTTSLRTLSEAGFKTNRKLAFVLS